jgi:hypothetical protein
MRANHEDKEVGKFFQGRFKAVRLLDEEAVLACSASRSIGFASVDATIVGKLSQLALSRRRKLGELADTSSTPPA